MNTESYIVFVKPVEILFIEIGDIFKIYQDYDKRFFIRLNNHQKLYITNKRTELGFYKFVSKKVLVG